MIWKSLARLKLLKIGIATVKLFAVVAVFTWLTKRTHGSRRAKGEHALWSAVAATKNTKFKLYPPHGCSFFYSDSAAIFYWVKQLFVYLDTVWGTRYLHMQTITVLAQYDGWITIKGHLTFPFWILLNIAATLIKSYPRFYNCNWRLAR